MDGEYQKRKLPPPASRLDRLTPAELSSSPDSLRRFPSPPAPSSVFTREPLAAASSPSGRSTPLHRLTVKSQLEENISGL